MLRCTTHYSVEDTDAAAPYESPFRLSRAIATPLRCYVSSNALTIKIGNCEWCIIKKINKIIILFTHSDSVISTFSQSPKILRNSYNPYYIRNRNKFWGT